MEVKMSMSGFSSAVKKLREYATKDLNIGEYVEQSIEAIKIMAQDFAAVNLGDMRSQIESSTTKTSTGFKGTVTAKGGLIFVEYGTGPRAMMPSANGLPKNPEDIPHTTSGKWFIPVGSLSASQAEELITKYGYPLIKFEDGNEYIICRGQPPQPFMYPAAIYEFEDVRKNMPEYIRIQLRRAAK